MLVFLHSVEKLKKDWSCPKCNCPEHANMIMCDLCETWFHWKCVGIKKGVIDDWYCGCAATR